MTEYVHEREQTEVGSSIKIIETAKEPRVEIKIVSGDSREAVKEAQQIALDTFAGTIEWLQRRGLRGAAT